MHCQVVTRSRKREKASCRFVLVNEYKTCCNQFLYPNAGLLLLFTLRLALALQDSYSSPAASPPPPLPHHVLRLVPRRRRRPLDLALVRVEPADPGWPACQHARRRTYRCYDRQLGQPGRDPPARTDGGRRVDVEGVGQLKGGRSVARSLTRSGRTGEDWQALDLGSERAGHSSSNGRAWLGTLSLARGRRRKTARVCTRCWGFAGLCAILTGLLQYADPLHARPTPPGVIIGRAGATIAQIRTDANVKAGVSKVVPGVPDRVLSIGGTVESVAKVR